MKHNILYLLAFCLLLFSACEEKAVVPAFKPEMISHNAMEGANLISIMGKIKSVATINLYVQVSSDSLFTNATEHHIPITGSTTFTTHITGLQENTTYYYRFVCRSLFNYEEYRFGEEYSITTSNSLFSINSQCLKVSFSKGNLQYNANTQTWQFAEHQYDYLGDNNLINAYTGLMDLFCWGSGDNPNRLTNNTYIFYDWGNNAISNGGNKPYMWRTLSIDEWLYIVHDRSDASSRRGVAKINGVIGLILLPDRWEQPYGITFYTGFATNGVINNNYTFEQWEIMDAAGAIFLPAAGRMWYYEETSTFHYTHDEIHGMYCSTSYSNNDRCDAFLFDLTRAVRCGLHCNVKHSVRLVRDAQ